MQTIGKDKASTQNSLKALKAIKARIMKKTINLIILGIFFVGWVIYPIFTCTQEYWILKNYPYGEKYNSFRLSHGIPVINQQMEAFQMPVNNHWGMIWIDEGQTSKENPLIHRIKFIHASEDSGWKGEDDAFHYFLNDTTDYSLKIGSVQSGANLLFEYTFSKRDRREIGDEGGYEEYSDTPLTQREADSIIRRWKIE
ncbi:hypothetical protein D4Z78_25255 [Okeania hirsuta]|nr:hypothetical protein D4Z78_25255 [Okeania hirsuta]